MVMNSNQKLLITVIVVVFVAYFIYMCSNKKKSSEGFTWANAPESQPGTYNLAPNDYELLNSPDEYMSTQSKFADIVGPAEPPTKEGFCKQVANSQGANYDAGLARIQEVGNMPLPTRSFDKQPDMLPVDPTSVTMFDRDVTDPSLYLFRPAIRAQIKNRQHATADPFRGDLPIVPCRRGWFDSRYGEGDAKLDAWFSPYTNQKYASLVSSSNLPINISNEEVLMDNYNDPIMSQY